MSNRPNDIQLIEMNDSDLEMVREWRNLPEVAQHMYTESIITEEMQKKWWEKVKANPSFKYFIISFNGKPLGVANFYDINQQSKRAYWAFYLGDNSVRGMGIGSKVEFNMLTKIFDEMNFNKLCCEVFLENDIVYKMHEGFGFRREGYYREHVQKEDKKFDVIALAMLNKEWQMNIDFMLNKINIKK